MTGSEEDIKEELLKLEGADRLEKAVMLHIHAINTPLMIAEGYIPEPGEPMGDKSIEKIRKSVEKIKKITSALKSELMIYKSEK